MEDLKNSLKPPSQRPTAGAILRANSNNTAASQRILEKEKVRGGDTRFTLLELEEDGEEGGEGESANRGRGKDEKGISDVDQSGNGPQAKSLSWCDEFVQGSTHSTRDTPDDESNSDVTSSENMQEEASIDGLTKCIQALDSLWKYFEER